MAELRFKSYVVFEELFKYSLVTYLILMLLETIKNGFVSNYFNLNILLVVVIASGIIMVTTSKQEYMQISVRQEAKKFTQSKLIYLLLLSLGSGLLVYFKMQGLGNISLFISLLTMAIVGIFSYLILTDTNAQSQAKPEALVVPSTPHLVHVQKGKELAAKELDELKNLVGAATEFFAGTKGEDVYKERVMPQSIVVIDFLESLKLNHDSDSAYNSLIEEIFSKKDSNEYLGEIPLLEEELAKTHRGNTEKLLKLHKDILILRLSELQMAVEKNKI